MFSFWLCSILVPIWIALFFTFKCKRNYGIAFAAALFLLAALALDGSKTSVGNTIIIVLGLNIVTTIIFFVITAFLANILSNVSESIASFVPLVLTAIFMFVVCLFCQRENDNRQLNNIRDSVRHSYEAKKSFKETEKRQTEDAFQKALENFEITK